MYKCVPSLPLHQVRTCISDILRQSPALTFFCRRARFWRVVFERQTNKQTLLFGAYLATVRRENDTSFSFFACNGKARCVNELFLLPYDAAPTTMTTLRQVGLTLIAVHAGRGKQDLAFLCIKDALHDEYSLGPPLRNPSIKKLQ